MTNKIKEFITKDIKMKIIIGIAISLSYYYAFYEFHQSKLETFIVYLIFGSILGYCIATSSEIVQYVFSKKYDKYRKSFSLQIFTEFILSAFTFIVVSTIFQTIFTNFIDFNYTIYVSVGVGIMSGLVFLFFSAVEQQKRALRLEKENKKLAVMKERNRIARELHDSVSQNIFGLNLQLNTLRELINKDTDEIVEIIDDSKQMVEEVQTEMRLMIYELRPDNLKDKEFFVAIEDLADLYTKRYKIDINTCLQGDEEQLSDKEQLVMYRIIQESISNSVKHSNTDKIDLKLNIKQAEQAVLIIEDYGQGFDTQKAKNKGDSYGLRTMEERIKEVSGQLKISSEIDQGTEIKAVIKLK